MCARHGDHGVPLETLCRACELYRWATAIDPDTNGHSDTERLLKRSLKTIPRPYLRLVWDADAVQTDAVQTDAEESTDG